MHTHRLAGDEFSDAKIDIFDAVRIFGNSSQDSIQIKQYLSYTNEPHTSPNSMTETYADLTFELADNNWKGVPINIVTGKKLEKKETYAEIYFKKNTKCIWGTECEDLEKNKLRIDIFPSQKVNLKVNSGFSPLRNLPKAVNLSFDLAGSVDKEKAFYSPYANVLHDIYNRDYIYGITLDEVLSSWRIIDEIMEYVDENRDNILEKY
jgi:glucose-6-phosphate 1-dehydrogenase